MSKLCRDLHHENEETNTGVGLACIDVATAGSTSRFFIRLICGDLCSRISVGFWLSATSYRVRTSKCKYNIGLFFLFSSKTLTRQPNDPV